MEGAEVTEVEQEKLVHLFKMTAEKRDYLMTLEQWQVMRKNNQKEETAELVVEEVDDQEKIKYNIVETRQDFTVEEDTLDEDDQKECSIF